MFTDKFFVHWNYESLKEYLFWCLVAIEYEDYLNLKEPAEIGIEDPNLTGALISFQNTPPKKYYDISTTINTLPSPQRIVGQNPTFFRNLLQGDGALIIEGADAISNGVFLDGLVKVCKKRFRVQDFEMLFNRFFPIELNKPGNRTRTGLALALTGKKNGSVFIMNQTVNNKLGVGRLLEYGKNGVRRTFNLELYGKRVVGVIKKYKYDEKEKKIILESKEVIPQKGLKRLEEKIKGFNQESRKSIFHRVFTASKKFSSPFRLFK